MRDSETVASFFFFLNNSDYAVSFGGSVLTGGGEHWGKQADAWLDSV